MGFLQCAQGRLKKLLSHFSHLTVEPSITKSALSEGFGKTDSACGYSFSLTSLPMSWEQTRTGIKLNIKDKLENYSIESDYNIEEFQELGCNLVIKPLKKHER